VFPAALRNHPSQAGKFGLAEELPPTDEAAGHKEKSVG